MKFQILIHGVDVIEDILGNAWYDTHQLRIMQLTLEEQSVSGKLKNGKLNPSPDKLSPLRNKSQQQCNNQPMLSSWTTFDTTNTSPPWCESSQRMSAHRQRWCHCIQPAHLKGKIR